METGSVIRRLRLRAGLTQRDLARLGRTSQATVSAYETGAKRPSIATLSRLLAATGSRLEIAGAADGANVPPSAVMRERGRRLVEVLELAEALPFRRQRNLSYPPLKRSEPGSHRSRGR